MHINLSFSIVDPSHYLPIAKAADSLGYYAITVADAPFYPEKTTGYHPTSPQGIRTWKPEEPFIDPWTVIPAMAAVTTRLHFWTSVLKLPLRNPILLAKAVASAAVLSNNRVALGVGTGFMPEEYAWTQKDFAARGELADECIQVIRLVTGGGMVEFHGKHYSFERLQISPVPSQPVPIYVGGQVKAALRRAGRLGDGWLPTGPEASEERLPEGIAYVRKYRAEAGRTGPFLISGALKNTADLDNYKRLAALGVTDLTVSPWAVYGKGPFTLEQKIEGLKRYAGEVLPKVGTSL